MENNIKRLCDKITREQQERLIKDNLGCQCNLDNAICTYKIKKKYTYIDIGTGGRYMIDNVTQEIYGIKGYGVINKKHKFGTLADINKYYWGNYTAQLQGGEK